MPDHWNEPACLLLLSIANSLVDIDKGISSIDSVVDTIRAELNPILYGKGSESPDGTVWK
jgi:hypothetical protein